jgi:DNA-binding NarL/FixJ family response regulator
MRKDMRKTRVLLADDHQIVLEGLQNLLEPEFEIVGTVEDGRALVKEAERLSPDVIVADISMPLLNGIEAVRQIRKTNDQIKVVFLTMHPDVTYATMAFDVGASGYVIKRSASRELITAINEVMIGRTYVTPRIAGELLHTYKKADPGKDVFDKRLTARQREILQLLGEGHSAKEIADLLSISPRTVETHKYNMMQELNLRTTADLIKFAIKHGIVSI